jgi:membrane-associated protein
MELIAESIDFIVNLDTHLTEIIEKYGRLTYLLLFGIIFSETGLFMAPFLPGDSLLFVIGALSASGAINIWLITIFLMVAAIIGDTVNYHIGKYLGPKIFKKKNVRFLNSEHLERAHEFYEKYGGKAIIIARFIPIIRTFAPFVAGMGNMSYGKFTLYNIVGGVLWVALCIFSGYFFGNIPVVKENFALVIVAIICISILPVVIEWIRNRRVPEKSAEIG